MCIGIHNITMRVCTILMERPFNTGRGGCKIGEGILFSNPGGQLIFVIRFQFSSLSLLSNIGYYIFKHVGFGYHICGCGAGRYSFCDSKNMNYFHDAKQNIPTIHPRPASIKWSISKSDGFEPY